ncbi:MAG TPA: ATP-binding protein [Alphaproteobacteria bacterium]|nr:ATP-binding protein [Alphaproteobacteria bacterium]
MADAGMTRGLTLQRAVAAPAALGTIAVSLIAGVTIALIYLNQATARLEGDMRHALASVRQAAASAAWTVDRPAAELIVQGLLTDPRVSRAGFEADAFDRIERGTPAERARRFEEPLVHDVQGAPKEIGRIYVETNPGMVERPLANAAIGIGLTMAGIAAAGSLWIIWLLQVRVGRPVQMLARHARDLATKPLKEVVPLELDAVGRVDEIRALGKVLDELRSGNLTTLSELADRRRSELEAQTSKLDALARMSGGVAHEFNNLLQPIATLSDMGRDNIRCSDADAAARYRQYFETISSSARLAAAIAADFLTFCGSTQRPTRIGDVSAAIRDAAAKLRPLLSSGRELRLDLAPDSFCRFDDLGLVQILNNLLKNANEAFPAGSAAAQYVAVSVAKTGGDLIELVVADNGPGMTEEVRARVFEPFFTTKGASGGSGLGLSVVYGIVTAWGGSVDLETRPGAGSKFVIRLPRASRFEAQRE